MLLGRQGSIEKKGDTMLKGMKQFLHYLFGLAKEVDILETGTNWSLLKRRNKAQFVRTGGQKRPLSNRFEYGMTFAELIRAQEEFLIRLLPLSLRLIETVDVGDTVILIEYLEQRGQFWHEFELLEQQLEPHRNILWEERVWKDSKERQLTKASLNRCMALLDEIMANDQISMAKLEEKIAVAELRLNQTKQA